MPTTEEFLALCYKCGLTNDDLENMGYGDCIDYIDAYIALHDDKKEHVIEATQEHFDNF